MDCSTDQELRTLIEAGCDERLFLNAKTGLNKYHLDPMLYTGSHYRGSCTCGSLTPFTWPIAVKAAERVRQSGSREFNQWAEEQRNRLKALIGGEVAFDVFFGHAVTPLGTIKFMQIMNVIMHDLYDFCLVRRWQLFSCLQKMMNVPENPGIALGGSAYHDAITAGEMKHFTGFGG